MRYNCLHTFKIFNVNINEVVHVRIIMAIVWAFILSVAISYVLTSMAGEPFNLSHTFVVAGILVVAVIALGDGALKESD